MIDASKAKRTLAEFKGKTVVLEWTSPSCPFAKAQYDSGRMQELQKWSAKNGIVWLSEPPRVLRRLLRLRMEPR